MVKWQLLIKIAKNNQKWIQRDFKVIGVKQPHYIYFLSKTYLIVKKIIM